MFSFAMAQRPKEHVRAAIVAAAAAAFADEGYPATTMAGVAERAGTSIGNVYRYFASKEALFAAVLPAPFAADLRARTKAQIDALGDNPDIRMLAPDAPYHVLSAELVDHAIAHRERVVILFARAEGTPFASFAGELRASLVEWALAFAARVWPRVRVTAPLRFALDRIYDGFFASLAGALTAFRGTPAIREAVAHLTSHHRGGLKRLFETAAGVDVGGGATPDGGSHGDHPQESRRDVVDPAPRARPRRARSGGASSAPPAQGARRAGGANRPRRRG